MWVECIKSQLLTGYLETSGHVNDRCCWRTTTCDCPDPILLLGSGILGSLISNGCTLVIFPQTSSPNLAILCSFWLRWSLDLKQRQLIIHFRYKSSIKMNKTKSTTNLVQGLKVMQLNQGPQKEERIWRTHGLIRSELHRVQKSSLEVERNWLSTQIQSSPPSFMYEKKERNFELMLKVSSFELLWNFIQLWIR